jgi:hypothetical protein
MSALPAEDFKAAIHETEGNLWITPSFLMTGAHWQALEEYWGIKNANPQ